MAEAKGGSKKRTELNERLIEKCFALKKKINYLLYGRILFIILENKCVQVLLAVLQ
jgi:hypothetical protein